MSADTRRAARKLCAALFALLALATASAADQPAVRQVLVLQSFDRGNLVLDHFTTNLRVDLDQRSGSPVNYIQLIVGPTGFVGAPEQSIVEFIRSTFADRPKPDLIVAVAGPAAVFARKYRQQLFPQVPLLFSAVDQRYLGDEPLGANETAVSVLNDFPLLVEDILQVRPQTRRVFVVLGSGIIGKFWRQRLEDQFGRFKNRVTFIWSDDMSFPEILRRCSALPADAAIFYLNFGNDSAGAAYADERVISDLHASASAPLFAMHSVFLGMGVVGGRMIDIDEMSRRTTDVAYRILNGESPSDVRPLSLLNGRPVFDWRELQRWEIPESRLPPGSTILNRGPSLWREYLGTILLVAATLVVQALLIVGLLLERRARRRAEIESLRNLGLASDVSRRETMSALASSISHELIQPLSAMILNTESLQLMLKDKKVTAEDIAEVLSDIHAGGVLATEIIERHRAMLRSREMQEKLIDLQTVMNDTLALVAHDMIARQVELDIKLSPGPCIVSGDPVMLEQVFVNLVMNAMDAMAQTPRQRRRIRIRSEIRGDEVDVSVQDTGPGLPAELVAKVFTPFVTTKPHGLGIGLAIARTIVEAHRGRIAVQNHLDGGAIFTVTLPISQQVATEPVAATVLN